MMKIKGTHLQIPIGIPNLFQGKLKQTTVICLKLYNSFFFKIFSYLARNSLDVSLLFA